MSSILKFLCLFLVLSSQVKAQGVSIYAGEHISFTRLVVELPAQTSWRVSQTSAGYRISSNVDFSHSDISNVFDRIARNRIREVYVSDQGNLEVTSNCNCVLKTFEFPNGIYIDFFGLEADDSISHLPTKNVLHRKIENEIQSKDIYIPGNTTISEFKRDYGESLDPEKYKGLSENFDGIVRVIQAKRIEANLPIDLRDSTSWYTDRIVSRRKSLMEAASHYSMAFKDSGSPEMPQGLKPGLTSSTGEKHGSMQVTDEQQPDFEAQAEETTSEVSCHRFADIDVSKWGTYDSRGTPILRAPPQAPDLSDSTTSAIEIAVKNYLHFSLGAEALQLMNSLTAPLPDEEFYRSMANIMEMSVRENSIFLDSDLRCDNRITFWAFLSIDDDFEYSHLNTESVLLTFSELPFHLRSHLGPVLAGRFLRIGAEYPAEYVLGLADGPMQIVVPKSEKLDDEIWEYFSVLEPESERSGLLEFYSNDRSSANLTVLMVARHLSSGANLPYRIGDALSSLITQYRGLEEEYWLAEAQFRLALSSGDLMYSIRLLNSFVDSPSIDEENFSSLFFDILYQIESQGFQDEVVQVLMSRDFSTALEYFQGDIPDSFLAFLAKSGRLDLSTQRNENTVSRNGFGFSEHVAIESYIHDRETLRMSHSTTEGVSGNPIDQDASDIAIDDSENVALETMSSTEFFVAERDVRSLGQEIPYRLRQSSAADDKPVQKLGSSLDLRNVVEAVIF